MFSPNSIIVVLSLVCISIGLGYLSSTTDNFILFVLVANVFITWSMLRIAKKERDWFNPLTLLIVFAWLRFTVPWILLSIEEPPSSIRLLRLSAADWQQGYLLSLFGLVSIVLGWYASPRSISYYIQSCIERLGSNRVGCDVVASWAYIMITLGMSSLTIFVVLNAGANVLAVIVTGNFRSLTIQNSTGIFYYLANAAIAGSILLTSLLIMKNRYPTFLTILPVVVVGAAFFVLGGRATSFMPIACALFVFWHVRLKRQLKPKWLLGTAALGMLLIMFSYAGKTYRGGQGVSGLSDVFSSRNLMTYIRYAVWAEFGQLHALAGAAAIGPGVLQGRTFIGALGKVSEWLGMAGKSAGVFIVQRSNSWKQKWALHSSLIGDSYLNFGLLGTFIVCIVFGAFLRNIYIVGLRMLDSPVGLSVCAIIIIYNLRIFLETVEKTFAMLVLLLFCLGGPFLTRFFQQEEGRA